MLTNGPAGARDPCDVRDVLPQADLLEGGDGRNKAAVKPSDEYSKCSAVSYLQIGSHTATASTKSNLGILAVPVSTRRRQHGELTHNRHVSLINFCAIFKS